MSRRAAICLVHCLAFGLTPARAEAPNLAADGTGAAGAASQLVLAQRVYGRAMANADPVLLLAAIRLARGVTTRPAMAWDRVTIGTPAPDQPAGRDGPPDPGGAQALDILLGLAADDSDLQDLVYDLDAQRPPQGQLQVATIATAPLGGGAQDDWRMPLPGAVAAEIALIGDGDSPLGLTVIDEAGAVVCALPPTRAPGLCRFTPARNGFFTVRVTNTGQIWNSYQLVGT